jgi:hypothetical protein
VFFIELMLAAYLIVAILATTMAFAAVNERGLRSVFILLGLIMPFILLYSIVASIFVRKPMPMYREEFAGVEDEIETERLKLFGGERVCPSFGDHWQRMYEAYLETIVDRVAKTSEKIASFSFRHAA